MKALGHLVLVDLQRAPTFDWHQHLYKASYAAQELDRVLLSFVAWGLGRRQAA
jgi:hypothetical protein